MAESRARTAGSTSKGVHSRRHSLRWHRRHRRHRHPRGPWPSVRALPFMAVGIVSASCVGSPLPPSASAAAVAAFEACHALGWEEKRACYQARLLDELADAGTVGALDMLEALTVADREARAQSHTLTHAIGISTYEPGDTFTDAFEECTEIFQSGCYHGVVQAYFIAAGEPDAEKVTELCAPYETDPADRWLFFQCLHGLGHGLTMYYGHHLLTALDSCDWLTDGWSRESCYGGAFMENVVHGMGPHHPTAALLSDETPSDDGAGAGAADHEADHGADPGADHGAGAHPHGAMARAEGIEPFEALRADDPHYPCSIVEEKYLTSCYLMQTSAMLLHNDGDVADAASSCLDAPEGWRDDCFTSLGRDISGRTLQHADDVRDECAKAPEAYREWCYVGAVRNFVEVTATTEAGFAFCRDLEDPAKPRCYGAMGQALYSLYPDEAGRREACDASETEALALDCRRGARVRPDPPTG